MNALRSIFRNSLTAIMLSSLVILTACSKNTERDSDKVLVVTTFTILANIASEVAGDALFVAEQDPVSER